MDWGLWEGAGRGVGTGGWRGTRGAEAGRSGKGVGMYGLVGAVGGGPRERVLRRERGRASERRGRRLLPVRRAFHGVGVVGVGVGLRVGETAEGCCGGRSVGAQAEGREHGSSARCACERCLIYGAEGAEADRRPCYPAFAGPGLPQDIGR